MNTSGVVYSVRLPDGRTFGPVDQAMLLQWAREGRLAHDTIVVSSAGREARAAEVPELRACLIAPPIVPGEIPQHGGDDSLATLIPYRNRPALIGYYLSIVGLLPVLGAPLAPAALILGIKGYTKWRADRRIKGAVHAWVAIVLGLIGCIINSFMLAGLIMAATR